MSQKTRARPARTAPSGSSETSISGRRNAQCASPIAAYSPASAATSPADTVRIDPTSSCLMCSPPWGARSRTITASAADSAAARACEGEEYRAADREGERVAIGAFALQGMPGEERHGEAERRHLRE